MIIIIIVVAALLIGGCGKTSKVVDPSPPDTAQVDK